MRPDAPRSWLPTLLLLALLPASSVALTGCPICNSDSQVLDDFEADCVDGPCRWTAVSGTIERVGTFHESEHGMRIGPGSTARRSVTYMSMMAPSALEVTARCDAGTLLRISLEGSTVASGDAGATGDPTRVSLDVDEAAGKELFEIYRGSFSWPSGSSVQSLLVETRGPGSCTIDDVIVTSVPAC